MKDEIGDGRQAIGIGEAKDELTRDSAESPSSFVLHPSTFRTAVIVALSVGYLFTAAYISRAHPYGTYATETDFYHYYAPDAERVAAWQFPENPFLGPGYPVVLALVTKLSGDIFTSGKWISVVSASLVGLLAGLLFARLFGYRAAIAAQLIIFASPIFPQFSIVATTDMFFLVLCLATFVMLAGGSASAGFRVSGAAFVAGFAYVTRYNGVFLLLTCLLGIVAFDLLGKKNLRDRLKLAALFVTVFLVTASPWFYANYKHRGSPFYNTNYLNVATQYYPELANEDVFQEGTRQMSEMFHSFGDVARYDPWRIIKNYPAHLYECVADSITRDLVSPWVGGFAVAGFLLALADRRSKATRLLLASVLIYFLFLALTHWETRYYLYIQVAYAGLASYAVFRLLDLARARGWARQSAFVVLPLALIAVMLSTSLAASRKDLKKLLSRHPTEVIAACDYFKGANVTGSRVMARKPHLPYICGQEWVYTPPVGSLDELEEWIRANPVDFVAVGDTEITRRPALAPLKDPSKAPPWLKPVWVSAKPLLVLYQTQFDR